MKLSVELDDILTGFFSDRQSESSDKADVNMSAEQFAAEDIGRILNGLAGQIEAAERNKLAELKSLPPASKARIIAAIQADVVVIDPLIKA